MTFYPRALFASFALLLLAGCSGEGIAHSLGLVRDSPDEFTVTTRAPLDMPDNMDLQPPRPGAPRPQEPAAQLAAEADLAPSVELGAMTGADTPGQDALVAAAGPPAKDNIRAQLDKDAPRLNSNAGVVNTLSFWRKTPPPGQVIDPVKEAARLRAAGLNTGAGAVPLQD